MVTTRRRKAESAEPSGSPPPPPPRRSTRAARNAASPLKSLDDVEPATKRQRGSGKAAVPKTNTKRKRDAPQNGVEEVESGPETEGQGLFFTENEALRRKVLDLESLLAEAEARETALKEKVLDLQALLRTGQGQANSNRTDIDMFGMTSTDAASNVENEAGLVGSDEAIALLRHVINSKDAPPITQSILSNEPVSPAQIQLPAQGESPRGTAEITPARPTSNPGSFFSRSISAIKSKLGFATTTPPQPSSTSALPPPNTMTEVLSTPPTPVGERSKAPLKKRPQSPMLRLFLKGVEAGDLAKAEKWAKQAIADMKNRDDYESRRARLQIPIVVDNLVHLPASKPWETGFGDPLGHLDDEDEAPIWAVYVDMLAQEEEPKKKRVKASHDFSMGVDDTLSLNDMTAVGTRNVHNSHGTSASDLDLQPRRSTEPSPMFSPSASHHQGNNVFNELKGQEAAAELHNTIKAPTTKTPTTPPKHNPSQGSYGLDYDSDDDETSMFSENSSFDGSTTPLWTQAPPPAPVPAHADLPGSETPSAATSQQSVHEIERQRQKLMKHTPAKPSRLREAFVPSPSILSDAGNATLASSFAGPGLYDDMPDAEDLGLNAEDLAAVQALRHTDEWKAADAAVPWPDAIMTYESEEETLSSE